MACRTEANNKQGGHEYGDLAIAHKIGACSCNGKMIGEIIATSRTGAGVGHIEPFSITTSTTSYHLKEAFRDTKSELETEGTVGKKRLQKPYLVTKTATFQHGD